MNDQKNMILAIVLSAVVLFGWNFFFGMPQVQKQKEQQQQQQAQKLPGAPPAPGTPSTGTPSTPGPPPAPGAAPTPDAAQAPGAPQPGPPASPTGQVFTREAVLAAGPRIAIDTPALKGSIALKGARLDDLALTQYRETVDPKSPPIVLLAPSGTEHPFYAEFGWVRAAGTTAKVPDAETVWRQEGAGPLAVGKPVTLTWDNGEGLEFRRTIAVDDKYLFTAKDEVANNGPAPVSLFPYALVSRHGTPKTEGYYILHEGFIGVMGGEGLKEESYKTVEEQKTIAFKATNGWLGFTDKY